jgi:hypothetical protein
MNKASVGSRAFVVRGAVLSFAALGFASCAAEKPGGAATTQIDGDLIGVVAIGGPAGNVHAEAGAYRPGFGSEDTCAPSLLAGSCSLTTCQLGPVPARVPGFGNFGPVSVTVGTTTESLTYEVTGYSVASFPASLALGTGDIMEFHGGDGVSIPKFDVSATIPGVGVITSPVPGPDGSGGPIIDTSQDLSITWEPISIGYIGFRLAADVTSSEVATSLLVTCNFEGASGLGVVPQTIVSTLKAMSGTDRTYITLSSELDATTFVDGLTIETQSFQGSPTAPVSFEVTLK